MKYQEWIIIAVCSVLITASAVVASIPPTGGFLGWSSIIAAATTSATCLMTVAVVIVFHPSRKRTGSSAMRVAYQILVAAVDNYKFWLVYLSMVLPACAGVFVQVAKLAIVLIGTIGAGAN